MARAWTRPVFQMRFPGPEISTSVKRSLGAMDLQNKTLLRIKAACERLKLKCEIPFYLPTCYAHICIPSKKLAIWMRQSRDSAQFKKIKDSFDGTGWQVFLITTRQIDQITDDDLTAQLGDAVRGMSK